MRGSGDHHSSGWPSENHGKMPLAIGIEQARRRQVAADGQQAVGLAQRGLGGRERGVGRVRQAPGQAGGSCRVGSLNGLCRTAQCHAHSARLDCAPVRTSRDSASAKAGSAIQWRLRTARQEAARQLVLALRAGLEAGQAFAQAVVDALVVAGLEMQAGQGGAAPQ